METAYRQQLLFNVGIAIFNLKEKGGNYESY